MRAVFILLSILSLSCTTSAPSKTSGDSEPLPNEPVSMQLPRIEPSLKGVKYSLLMDFENQRDMLFMNTPDSGSNEQYRHTGFRSLQLAGGMKSTIKLSSLMAGRAFPGDYTLIGAYFKSDRIANITLRCKVNGFQTLEQAMSISAGEWKPILLDLTELKPSGSASDGTTSLEIVTDSTVFVDDVLLIDNTHEYTPPSEGGWSVVQKGFKLRVDRPSMFSLSLDLAQGRADGWTVEEANAARARFSQPSTGKSLTVYNDGRSFWDATYKPLSAAVRDDSSYAQQHSSPARIDVPEELGRVIRNSKGDANADGYDETRGCYMIAANSARLQIQISPGSTPVSRPVLEITGMPPGKVLVNVEGQIVDGATRLPDGTVLLMLPLKFARPTQISLRIE